MITRTLLKMSQQASSLEEDSGNPIEVPISYTRSDKIQKSLLQIENLKTMYTDETKSTKEFISFCIDENYDNTVITEPIDELVAVNDKLEDINSSSLNFLKILHFDVCSRRLCQQKQQFLQLLPWIQSIQAKTLAKQRQLQQASKLKCYQQMSLFRLLITAEPDNLTISSLKPPSTNFASSLNLQSADYGHAHGTNQTNQN